MINGKKIYLCGIEPSSLEELMDWRNETKLRQYFREYREINTVMQHEWYDKINHDKNQVNFEIHDKESDLLIGHCGLYYINWVNRTGEFGIYIGNQNFRDGGYGSDTLRTLIKYGFEELNLNKIWAEVYSNNDALKVYTHIGFVKEGVVREQVYKNGKYWDATIISMLKSEYECIKVAQEIRKKTDFELYGHKKINGG